MPTTIKLKNSVTTTNAPSSLAQGEVAINVTDKKVWVGNAATTPVLLLGSGADGTFTNLTVSGVATFGAGTVSAPSITTTGDTNTGIFFPAADTIAFTEGGAESMRINVSGDVGIGTVSPAHKLDVNGQLQAKGQIYLTDSSSNDILRMTEIGARDARIDTFNGTDFNGTLRTGAGLLTFETGTGGGVTERMRITSTGGVGINTSSPSAQLDVNGTTNIVNSAWLTFSGSNTLFSNAASVGGTLIQSPSSAENIIFRSSSGTEQMRIVGSTGSVGIGTSSPGVRLDVVGGTIRSSISGGTPIFYLNNGTSQHSIQNNSGSLGFYNDASLAMTINSSLNVLIGTTTNTGKLVAALGGGHVFNVDTNSSVLGSPNGVLISNYLNQTTRLSAINYGAISSTEGVLIFGTATSSTLAERMRITNTGLALFGATSSSFSMPTTGGASFKADNTGGGSPIVEIGNTNTTSGSDSAPAGMFFKGSATTSSSARFVQFSASGTAQQMGAIVGNGAGLCQFLNISDAREKTNISPLTNALARVTALKPSTFTMISTNEHIAGGFIAQEVLEVFPEYVVENASNEGQEQRYGLTGGMTGGYIAVLTAALQELKAELDSVKAELQTLKGN